MMTNFLENRQEKLLDFSSFSDEYLAKENIETKLKKRKSKIFLIMSNKRREYIPNNSKNNDLNLNNTANFIKIFNLMKNKEEKSKLINYLFQKKIPNVKNILSKYQKALNLIIDYNFISTSNFILDIIEKNDEIIELITTKKENIKHLIEVMNLISNGKDNYDCNYIMITANLLIYSKTIDKILKKELLHNKIIELIIKNETALSYSYLFYIYAYLYYFDIKQIESFENILDSLLLFLNQDKNKISLLIEDIYDILIIFSKVPKFSPKFFDNYNSIFGIDTFNEKDLLIEQKLTIISNLYKISNSQQIKLFLEKDNGNILNLVLYSLKAILNLIKSNYSNINDEKTNVNLLLLNSKILLTITYHKDLTYLFLENKEYFNLVIMIFSSIISLKLIFNNNKLNEIINIILNIVNNIIKNEHKLFVSQIISNNLHLGIKDKFYYYINSNSIHEKHFISLINIISSLYDNQKKYKLKTELVKLDLDNNRFNDIIIGIIKKFGKNKNIYDKCSNFLDIYYSKEPRENFLQLSDFNFLNLNI